MRIGLITLALILLPSLAPAGKNANGALIVHVVDYCSYDHVDVCGWIWDNCGGVESCEETVTQTNEDEFTPTLIYLVAAFPPSANPGVSVVYFGLDHNLPVEQGYFDRWGLCGPAGSLEIPDAGWPDTGGNSVAFGTPVVGDTFFHFYALIVYGEANGSYVGTAINPTGGYAAFVDDSNPPLLDEIHRFGRVRWYQPGYNECPVDEAPTGACCFPDEICQVLTQAECDSLGNIYMGDDIACDPNPCVTQFGACCFPDGHCEVLALDACNSQGGTYMGDGTVCVEIVCPADPRRACCIDGVCRLMTEEACAADGGVWHPFDLDCRDVICPPVAIERTSWGAIKSLYH